MDWGQAQQDLDGAQAAARGAEAKARSEGPHGGCPFLPGQTGSWGPGGWAGFHFLRSCGTAGSGRFQGAPMPGQAMYPFLQDTTLESLSHSRAPQRWGGERGRWDLKHCPALAEGAGARAMSGPT